MARPFFDDHPQQPPNVVARRAQHRVQAVAVCALEVDKLFALLSDVVARRPGMNVTLVDTRGTLARALSDGAGESGNWENEIHPTAHG